MCLIYVEPLWANHYNIIFGESNSLSAVLMSVGPISYTIILLVLPGFMKRVGN